MVVQDTLRFILRWLLVLVVLITAKVGVVDSIIILLALYWRDRLIADRTLHRLARQMVDANVEIKDKDND
jgi:signal transduction histidine kinase